VEQGRNTPADPRTLTKNSSQGASKCGKMDHIVKNYPQLTEEQESELPKSQFRKQGGNSSGKRFVRAMLAA